MLPKCKKETKPLTFQVIKWFSWSNKKTFTIFKSTKRTQSSEIKESLPKLTNSIHHTDHKYEICFWKSNNLIHSYIFYTIGCHPYDDFNPLCSSKPHKYGNYDEAPHLVSSSTQSPKKTSSLVPQAELTINYSLDKPINNLMCRVFSKHLSGVGSTWCRRWSLSSN